MVPRHFGPDPRRPFTAAGETSTIELEVLRGRFEGCITYRVDAGEPRTIPPGHRLHRTLVELLRVIGADAHPIVTEYERELHEDVLAYEQERREREYARLYGVAEARATWWPARGADPMVTCLAASVASARRRSHMDYAVLAHAIT